MLFNSDYKGRKLMTRTARYKAYYFITVCLGAAIVGVTLIHLRFSGIAVVFTLGLLLAPGRVLGFFWRDLLRGLRLLNAKKFAESKRHSERFLSDVRKRPWLKKLVWLGSSAYSRDPEVLALNNLGAAEIGLGNIDSARNHLIQALHIDNQCPLPYFNLGILAAKNDDATEADRCFNLAMRLGFSRRLSDKIVMSSQARFAAIDGAGLS